MPSNMPSWLPDLVTTSGDWNRIVRMLYKIFDRDFRQVGCSHEGLPIRWDERRIDSPYDEGFWHLITQFDYKENERIFDPRRAERLPWCAPTIDNSSDPEVIVWRYEERKHKIRTYLWLEEWDYVVLLEERTFKPSGQRVAFLVTAFHIGGKQTRENLRRKYNKRVT